MSDSVKDGVDFATEVKMLEAFLLQHLPMVPFKNDALVPRLRVVLAWDGLKVIPYKITDLPPPSAEDLQKALTAFRQLINEVLTKAQLEVRV